MLVINMARTTLVILSLLITWQCIVWYWQIPDYLLSSPLQVFATFLEQHALLLQHGLITLYEILLGFGLGVLFGSISALLIAYFKPLRLWLLPLLLLSQALPTFAIAPLIVVWLGFGMASKIIVTMLMIFFPVTSAFYDRLRRVDSAMLELAHMMGASKWRQFIHITLPAALPGFASGVRIAAVTAPIGAIVGEWVGSSRGLGYLMLNANARMQIDQMFAALAIIILIALVLYFCVDQLLQRLIWWEL